MPNRFPDTPTFTGLNKPCFVPRSPDAPEGDGYLLAALTCYEHAPHTRLAVLDTQDIEQGPIATIYMPLRLRGAVHGNWVAESVLNGLVRPAT